MPFRCFLFACSLPICCAFWCYGSLIVFVTLSLIRCLSVRVDYLSITVSLCFHCSDIGVVDCAFIVVHCFVFALVLCCFGDVRVPSVVVHRFFFIFGLSLVVTCFFILALLLIRVIVVRWLFHCFCSRYFGLFPRLTFPSCPTLASSVASHT